MSAGFGQAAVALARSAVRSEVTGSEVMTVPSDPRFAEPSGAFVTLNTYPSGDLRGCIGYPLPSMPLGETIVESARAACHDPRFPPLSVPEIDAVTVEVTVLTVPEEIVFSDPSELLGKVVVGRDGLIIEYRGCRGLLLPQVPTEYGWDAMTYLEHLSMKAGMPPDAWTCPGVRVWAFKGEVWTETSPGGPVEVSR